ncbi:MAG TPA: acyltransferase, partial [Rhodospirillaceae bacterium]|nr:acyltransferase [Rhodospirillaceae bacterium]
MERIATPPSRLAALDSLRGIAILAVLVSHLSGTLGLGRIFNSAMIDLGRGGVTLFFILSGYLIFRNVQVQSVPTFFCRRFFKVMPSYWLNIGIILLADLTLPNGPHFPAGSYLAGVGAVSDVLGVEAVSGVFWTLLIEIKFYLFIAVQYALFKGRRSHLVLLTLIALEIAVWAIRGRGSLTLAYFPIFYLGIEMSLAEADNWRRPALLRL